MFHTTRKTKQKRKRKEYPRSFRFDLFSAVFFFFFFLSPDLFIKASLTMKVLTIYVYWFFLCKYNLLAWLFRAWLRACTKSFSLECELEVFRHCKLSGINFGHLRLVYPQYPESETHAHTCTIFYPSCCAGDIGLSLLVSNIACTK